MAGLASRSRPPFRRSPYTCPILQEKIPVHPPPNQRRAGWVEPKRNPSLQSSERCSNAKRHGRISAATASAIGSRITTAIPSPHGFISPEEERAHAGAKQPPDHEGSLRQQAARKLAERQGPCVGSRAGLRSCYASIIESKAHPRGATQRASMCRAVGVPGIGCRISLRSRPAQRQPSAPSFETARLRSACRHRQRTPLARRLRSRPRWRHRLSCAGYPGPPTK
jgi:hypothetical protein